MKKLLGIFLSVMLLTGCDTIRLTISEDEYTTALSEGNLAQQLVLVDELSALSPEKYKDLAAEKNELMPVLLQLMDDPKNYQNLSDEDLERSLAFAPKYEPFSFLKKYLKEKSRISEEIKRLNAEVAETKSTLVEKISITPKHIETYDTEISFNGLARYFLRSRYIRKLTFEIAENSFNAYQIESFIDAMSKISTKNQQLIENYDELSKLGSHNIQTGTAELENENGDIKRVLVWLYKQHLMLSFKEVSKKNRYLLSMLESSYGRETLDEIWLRLVEPAAKKAVMSAKENYLSILDLLAARISKLPSKDKVSSDIYGQTLEADRLMLALLWPPNGLDNFKETSLESRNAMKVLINNTMSW